MTFFVQSPELETSSNNHRKTVDLHVLVFIRNGRKCVPFGGGPIRIIRYLSCFESSALLCTWNGIRKHDLTRSQNRHPGGGVATKIIPSRREAKCFPKEIPSEGNSLGNTSSPAYWKRSKDVVWSEMPAWETISCFKTVVKPNFKLEAKMSGGKNLNLNKTKAESADIQLPFRFSHHVPFALLYQDRDRDSDS